MACSVTNVIRQLACSTGASLRGEAADARWPAQPPDKALVLVLRIGQALFVAWEIESGVMTVHRWSPRGGYSHTARTYP